MTQKVPPCIHVEDSPGNPFININFMATDGMLLSYNSSTRLMSCPTRVTLEEPINGDIITLKKSKKSKELTCTCQLSTNKCLLLCGTFP